MIHKLQWALTGALALVAVLALARATTAGPLDPPGPVGSTMRTLDQLLPSWGQTLSSTGGCTSPRFQCVMASNAAVLDKETGLVWLRNPVETFTPYGAASDACGLNAYGGRTGWRLPTTTEMFTLVDTSADSLPDGHPFQNVSGGPYWTTTVNREDDQLMQTVGMFGGFNEELAKSRYGSDGPSLAGAWCVRGGQSLAEDPAPAEQPAWSRTLSAEGGCESARFECVMNGTAVLDRETGLVWERAPSSVILGTWNAARDACIGAITGGRGGWRLPTIHEAFSLTLFLPAEAPFTVNLPAFTSLAAAANSETIGYGFTLTGSWFALPKTQSATLNAWCVRGAAGQGY